MRLRQVALVARELDPVVADLTAVLGIEVAFHDPGVAEFGLRNAVMPVGDTFLEVVSPVQETTTAGRWLERHGGDGGYMVILQTEDLEADRRRLARLGIRLVWQIALDDIAAKLGERLSEAALVKGLHPFLRMAIGRMVDIGVPAAVFVLPLQPRKRIPPVLAGAPDDRAGRH